MLTGQVPFRADSPLAVLMKHVSEPIPIPSGQRLAEPLWKVVEKCLAKAPDDRWPSATSFAAAMEGAVATSSLESDAVLVAPASSTTGAARELPATAVGGPSARSPKRRAVLRWAIGAGISAAVLAGLTWYTGRQSTGIVTPDAPVTLGVPSPSISTSPVPATPDPETREPSTPTEDESAVRAGAADETGASPTAIAVAGAGAAVPPREPLETEQPSDIVPQSEQFHPETVGGIESRPAAVSVVDGIETVMPGPSPPRGLPESAPAVGDIEPVPVWQVAAEYPQIARAAEIEGDVVLSATINPAGTVIDVSVLRSPHRVFDEPARRAVLQWRYTPGRRNGVPAEYQVQATVRFRLD